MKSIIAVFVVASLLVGGFAAAQGVDPLNSPVGRIAQGWTDVPVDTQPDPNDKWPRGSRYDAATGVRMLPEALSQAMFEQAHNRNSPVKSSPRFMVTEEMFPLEVSPDDLRPQKDKSVPRLGSRHAQPTLNKKLFMPYVQQAKGNWPVLVIAYTPIVTNASNIPSMTLEWARTLQQGSTWGNRSQPSLRPEVYGGTVRVWNKTTPFKSYAGSNRYMDYTQIWAENGVCALVNSGAIRGVVVWNAGEVFNNRENAYVDGTSGGWSFDGFPGCGNEAYYPYSAFFLTYVNCVWDDPQDGACYRPTAPAAYWAPQDVSQAVHSFAHWLEARFTRMPATRCDFLVSNGPGASTPNDVPLTNTGTGCNLKENGFIATQKYFANNQTYYRPSAVCGDVHFAPNAQMSRASGVSNGIYSLTESINSQCWGWQIGTTPTYQNVTCATWGCSAIGYYTWWMRGIPGLNNNHREESGFTGRNWWLEAFLIQAPETVYGF
jgi:hypothetical protein